MKEKLLETVVSLTETTDTKSGAEKINEFFTKPEMQATGWILLSVAVIAVAGYFLVKFLKSKKYIR